jgi:hypothetical protein
MLSELINVLEELLKAGDHEGECDNQSLLDPCSKHLEAYEKRYTNATEFLSTHMHEIVLIQNIESDEMYNDEWEKRMSLIKKKSLITLFSNLLRHYKTQTYQFKEMLQMTIDENRIKDYETRQQIINLLEEK